MHAQRPFPGRSTAALSGPLSRDPSAPLDAEIQALGQGLMRLAHEGSGALPRPAPSDGASRPPLIDTREPVGLAFGHLIAAMASRSAVWGSHLLATAAQRMWAEAVVSQPDAFFSTDLRTMNIVSHAIEERVIAQRLDCEIYAGFQRMALLRPQLPRYRALLDSARYVCVYGLDDAGRAPQVAELRHPGLLRFPIDRRLATGLEWYWFVVVDHPQLRTALLAQHTDGDLFARRQGDRAYAGIWTFDPALVHDIVAALRQAGRALYYSH